MDFQFGFRERAILVAVAVVLVVAGVVPTYMVGAAVTYQQEAIARQQTLQSELDKVRANRREVAEQRRLYDAYLESYQLWRERGVVAETADTIVWRNLMYDIKQKRDLGVIDFSFGESRLVLPEDSVHTRESTASTALLPMRISMPMLHDMDMFMFLSDLSSRADGLFFPLSCEMTRLQPGFEAELRDNVRGQCEIVWVFMQDPDERSI